MCLQKQQHFAPDPAIFFPREQNIHCDPRFVQIDAINIRIYYSKKSCLISGEDVQTVRTVRNHSLKSKWNSLNFVNVGRAFYTSDWSIIFVHISFSMAPCKPSAKCTINKPKSAGHGPGWRCFWLPTGCGLCHTLSRPEFDNFFDRSRWQCGLLYIYRYLEDDIKANGE